MKPKTIKLASLSLIMAVTTTVNFKLVSAQETSAALDYATLRSQMSVTIERQMKANQITGLGIALVDDQKVVWAEGFGEANLEQKIRVTPDTLFRIGSISKLFTATAIMRLVDAGKIDLEQPLQTYIPEFAIKSRFPRAGQITIHSLLTHHSGLPNDLYRGQMSFEPEYFASIINELKDEYVAYEPNYIYSYSNLGMALLGVVIERVTGQKFNDYMETEILKPLGMNRSSFILREDMKSDFCRSYSAETPIDEPLYRALPAGTMYSSVNQMGNFIKMVFAEGHFQDQVLLKQATLTKMLTPQNYSIPLDRDWRVGLGWHLFDATGKLEQAGKIAWHTGGTPFYQSALITLPEQKLGVIVLSSSGTDTATIHGIATDTLQRALEVKNGRKALENKPMSIPERALTEAEIKPYEGSYAVDFGILPTSGDIKFFKVHPKGKTWWVRCHKKDYLLRYHEGRWFSIPELCGDQLYFRFTRINDLTVIIAKSAVSKFETVCGEAVDPVPLPEFWRKRCGTYRVINDPIFTDLSLELTIDEQFLFIRTNSPEQPAIVLTPLSETSAITRGLGEAMHQTVRFERSSGKNRIIYSGLILEEKIP